MQVYEAEVEGTGMGQKLYPLAQTCFFNLKKKKKK